MQPDNRRHLIETLSAWDRHLSDGVWRESVVRRAAMLLFIVAPGLALNFLLAVAAAHILEAREFGIFYFGLTISQLFAAPSVILSFFLARRIAVATEDGGEAAAWRIAPALFRKALVIVAVIVVGALAAVMIASWALSVEAPWLVPIIALHVASFYLVDMARGFLNGMHRFLSLGLLGTGWMAGRFAFGMTGAWATGTVWASLLGVALAGIVAAGVFFLAIGRRLRAAARETPHEPAAVGFGDLLGFAVGYGLVIAIAYLDILLGYVILDRQALGAYSASAVLPKGVFTLTLPIIQVMFAALIGRDTTTAASALVMRAIAMTATLTLAGTAVMWIGRDVVCGGQPWRIGACEPELLFAMALAVAPISLLRCLVAMQLAKGAIRHPLLLILPAGGFVAYGLAHVGQAGELAFAFNMFVVVTLVFYGALCRWPSAPR